MLESYRWPGRVGSRYCATGLIGFDSDAHLLPARRRGEQAGLRGYLVWGFCWGWLAGEGEPRPLWRSACRFGLGPNSPLRTESASRFICLVESVIGRCLVGRLLQGCSVRRMAFGRGGD